MRVNKTVRAKAELFSKVSEFIEKNNLSLILNDYDVLESDKMYFVERGINLKEKKLIFLDYLYLGLALSEEFESEMLLMDIATSSFYFKDGELVYASEEPFEFDEDFEGYMMYEEQRDRYLKAKEQIKKEVKLVSEFVKSLKITSDKKIYNTYNTCHLDSVKGKGKDKKGNEIKLKLVSETFKDTFNEVDIYYYDLKNEIAYRFVENG
jgi:hypothetical protein